MNAPLTPYLYRSFAAHGVLLAGLAAFGGRAAVKADKVYTIDFVGSSAVSVAGGAASAAKATAVEPVASKPAPQADPDEWAFGRRRKGGRYALPRPSLLKGWTDAAPVAPQRPTLSQGAGSASGEALGGGAGDAGVATDLPNFPYPWYISQIRLMLFNAWQKRMPGGGGEGVVVFSIMRNGAPTDLRMESSSGDAAFDAAALESVQAAAPFPALPSGFPESFLKIHLTLKSQ
ncbi:MAG: energy transducer TonB [Elusimicrobiota bacterium]|nr:energy transducer TonB [Elusimicrobiota bacterium]